MPGTVPEASPEPPAEGVREPLPETSGEIAREMTVELRPEMPGEQLPETAVVETPQISVEDVLEAGPYLRAEATGESTEEPEAEAATERVTDAVPESGADTAGERSEDVTAVVRPNSTQIGPHIWQTGRRRPTRARFRPFPEQRNWCHKRRYKAV